MYLPSPPHFLKLQPCLLLLTPKVFQKFSILAVSICSPPTHSSIHSILSSTLITSFKKLLWASGNLSVAKVQGQFSVLTLLEMSAGVMTAPLISNHLGSQDSTIPWFSSHLPGCFYIFFAGSSSLSNMLEFLQCLVNFLFFTTPIKNITKSCYFRLFGFVCSVHICLSSLLSPAESCIATSRTKREICLRSYNSLMVTSSRPGYSTPGALVLPHYPNIIILYPEEPKINYEYDVIYHQDIIEEEEGNMRSL